MDPHQHSALQSAKLQSILRDFQRTSNTTASAEMPPPPAYHMVVDAESPIPTTDSSYDPEEDETEEEGIPEININATTQIRGHGNIISIAQMDSVRIAHLVASLVSGGTPISSQQHSTQGQPEAQDQTQAQSEHTPSQAPWGMGRKEMRSFPRININVNCGATIIGDRNIVGPGLGDIARHMQMAQRNRAVQQQQQQQQQMQMQQMKANRPAGTSGLGFPIGGHTPILTPPISRSSSFGSEGFRGMKRKVEDGAEENVTKKAC